MCEHFGFFPSPPPGGGFLVLNKAQLSNLDLLCAIRSTYPQTKIVVQQMIPVTSSGRRSIWTKG